MTSRAYVITEEIQHDSYTLSKVVGLRSNRKITLSTCEELVGEPFHWEFQDKHKGRVLGTDINVSYEMFYVNKDIKQ